MILSMLILLYNYDRIAADVARRTRTAIMAVCGIVGKAEDKVCSDWHSRIHRPNE